MSDAALADAAATYKDAQKAADDAKARLALRVQRAWQSGRTATEIAEATGVHRLTIGKWVAGLRSEEGISENDVAELRGVVDCPAEWSALVRRLVDRHRGVSIADCSRASGISVEAGYARLHDYK
jgi:hypothetical protein